MTSPKLQSKAPIRRGSAFGRIGARACAVSALFLASFSAPPARAFPHVVQPGDTLAKLAQRYYGKDRKSVV